ncbi:MAG TPA: hypothetical protein VFF40_11330 [Acidimicrobiia bacterium]|nr:hypothetical protein [Acidimicrobiia bacterium]
MTTAARRPPRSVDDLEPADRDRLARAHKRLREATDTYEPFHGGEITPNQDAPVHEVLAMAAAQAEVQDAEDALWRLREELLGWARPAWAPNAALVADWFSDEDRIYDEAGRFERCCNSTHSVVEAADGK